MSLNYDAVDLMWSTTGDFVLGPDGDLADTRFDVLLAIAQDVYDRCKSDIGDWKEIPLMGATLSDFTGEPNTAANGRSIRDRLFNALQVYGTVAGSDLSIDVFPVAKDKIAVKIQLRVAPTPQNRYSRILERVIIYDYVENHIVSR